MAKAYNYDFSKSVSRHIEANRKQLKLLDNICSGGSKSVYDTVKNHDLAWFRIGVMGDPCHDWELTVKLCEWLGNIKTPVIVTKHWISISDSLLKRLKEVGVVFNTSVSALDTTCEISYRLNQFRRIKEYGIGSFLRVVSCRFGNTRIGKACQKIQKEIFNNKPVIDNPLRIPLTDSRVVNGHIITDKVIDLNGETSISMFNSSTYIGHCGNCPDQCGVL